MKRLLKGIAIVTALVGVVFLLMLATDTAYLLRGVRTTYLRGQTGVDIYDYTVQSTKTIHAQDGHTWELDAAYNQLPLGDTLESFLKKYRTTAFIIIKDGKILAEKYYNGASADTLSGVWSVTKTYTSLLVLKAVEDGLINSIDDPVSNYLPEWKVKQSPELTLRHLASMSTGLYWEELDQRPLSLIAKLNFYGDLEKFVLNDLYAVGNPGDTQHYDSGATQLLGIVLKRVLGEKSISDYLAEKFWIPLGCENDALYIVDSCWHGNEKTFGGLVATARDISRLGVAIAHNGVFNKKQILSPHQMSTLTRIPFHNKTYAYGIWTGEHKGKRFYYQSGHRGQFIISFPAERLVITRLGHEKLKKADQEDVSAETFFFIEEALKMIASAKQNR